MVGHQQSVPPRARSVSFNGGLLPVSKDDILNWRQPAKDFPAEC